MDQNHASPARRVPSLTQVVVTEGIQALIIDYYANQHHPLAGGIQIGALATLTVSLLSRFEQVAPRLHISNAGMKRLPAAARAYARRAAGGAPPFTDEDHLRITREIAAYLGCVALQFGKTTWVNPGSLLEVAAETRGDLVVDNRRVGRLLMNIGCLAAVVWDSAVYGNAHRHDPIVWETWE